MASNLRYLVFDNIKRNNRIAYLINFLSVMILLFCFGLYLVKHWFTVDKIIITGDIKHVTPVQLSYIAHNKLHGTFFTLDIAELKEEFQSLPWVRKVSLKRNFPHTIVVTIEEYKAIARIGDDALLSNDGQVFGAADDSLGLPTFYVEPSSSALALSKYQQIQTVLVQHNDSLVNLWLDSPKIARFVTAKNLTITICDEDLSAKLALLNRDWDKLYQLNPQLKSINFCYKNALAINSK